MRAITSLAGMVLLVLAGMAVGQTTQPAPGGADDPAMWEKALSDAEAAVRQKLLSDPEYKKLLDALAERDRALIDARLIGDNQVKLDAMNAFAKAQAALRAYEEAAFRKSPDVQLVRRYLPKVRAAAAARAHAAEFDEYSRTEMYDAIAAKDGAGPLGDSPLRPKDPEAAFARVKPGMTQRQLVGYLGGFQIDVWENGRLSLVWKFAKTKSGQPMRVRAILFRGVAESITREPMTVE